MSACGAGVGGTAMGEISKDRQVYFSHRKVLSLRTVQINTGRNVF